MALSSTQKSIRHVILDRDGVLNHEALGGQYIKDPSEFRWLEGSLEAIRHLHEKGIRISIATNQSGIGRGLMTLADLDRIHQKIANDAEGMVADIFVCPHAPDAGCSCRKPKPDLVSSALAASQVPKAQALLVGNDIRDLEAAKAAGIDAVLVRTGQGHLHESAAVAAGYPVCHDLRFVASQLTAAPPATETVEIQNSLEHQFQEHIEAVERARRDLPSDLERCARAISGCLRAGGKVLVCGNGGSAADAEHFVAELVGRFLRNRPGIAAISLACGSATSSAIANDFGFEHVFARQVDALAQRGDVLIAISTSGRSPNILAAARAARARGCMVVGLTGSSGHLLGALCDHALRAPSTVTARIQEIHGLCLHMIASIVDGIA